ncbi:Ribosome LSU-associated GTP-binding protein HflX [hydrothermal vent metagenome]|uniref:Ribosome LSU-associated GTP-binding protein HflX n=1 Tax=hydrothermal vent metagenome TaxID=652676 RepID=A0A3B1D9S2_9ZZZZ
METRKTKEKILLVIIFIKQRGDCWTVEELQQEMVELVSACGGEVVGSIVCRMDTPDVKCFIREGKLQEIIDFCDDEVDTVIFSHDLKGSQQRNLEDRIKTKTIDRTQLILDIFARHASSKEGKMQVELAQLKYLLPRLTGKGIELSRLGGGIGTLGPGETKLEVDRRRISDRITHLKRGLDGVVADRALKRKKRKDHGVPLISLVGYTNAGKSTLLNTLTQAEQQIHDGVFTTLDSLSRQCVLPNHQKIVLSDTVGFIHDLPHHLIESFKATLEEVRGADLLLRVLDVSQENFRHLHEAVASVLRELEAYDIPTIIVLNKIDQLEDLESLKILVNDFDHAVSVSAMTGENIPALLEEIMKSLSDLMVEIDVDVPIKRMDLVNLVHKEGNVFSIKYYEDTINIRASIPTHIAGKFNPFF